MSGKNQLFKSGKKLSGSGGIFAGFGKSAGFQLEPKSGIALIKNTDTLQKN